MKCLAYCTAYAFKNKLLHDFLRKEYKVSLYQDVLFIETKNKKEKSEFFVFPYGVVVFWNTLEEEIQNFLKILERFEEDSLKKFAIDSYEVTVGSKIELKEDLIILPNQSTISKLAVSHGLAQSVKLESFEDIISHVFEETKQIPHNLCKMGKIYLSRKEIRKKMGELFIERNAINLHVDILDTPDFFWEHPKVEKIYEMISGDLEIKIRGQILNQRLNIVKELFEMLGTELNHQHSNRLEWAIIWLIFIEIILTLLTIFKVIE